MIDSTMTSKVGSKPWLEEAGELSKRKKPWIVVVWVILDETEDCT